MQKILILLTEGYADWEIGLIAAELNKPEYQLSVKTIVADKQPIRSMAGLSVLPDYSLDDYPTDFSMLIMPGGIGWLAQQQPAIIDLIEHCRNQVIPVAAICDAVTFLANHGYLDKHQHCGNGADYLKFMAPNYHGQDYFIATQALTAGNLITANGTAPLEFGREILTKLALKPDLSWARERLQQLNVDLNNPIACWYALWKRGAYDN